MSSRKRSSSVAGFDDDPVLHASGNSSRAYSSRDKDVTPVHEVVLQSPKSFVSASTPCDHLDVKDAISTSSELPDNYGSQSTPASLYSSSSLQSSQTSTEVCFGMLVDVLAAPLRKPVSKESMTEQEESEASWPVAFRSGTAVLVDQNLAEVGQLDMHNSSILSKLKKQVPSLRCEVFLISSETSKSGRQSLRKAFEAVVNLYGCYTYKDKVGTHLDEAKAYLQEPIRIKKGIPYSNPHVFTATDDNMTPIFGDSHDEARKIFASAVASIMNQSTTFHDNSSFCQDDRILSPLNKHQIVAVKFAMIREHDRLLTSTPTLWRPFWNSLGSQYRHSITRVLNSHPRNECRGGLLADEMGMGKSLSMLSLIVHTLDEAREFVQTPQLSDSEVPLVPSRATLIITPKSTLDSWMKEIRQHLRPGCVHTILYHGPEKNKHLCDLKHAEVVLTTYETVTKSWASSENVLGQFSWFRVILDEAQQVRNTKTQAFSAVSSLAVQRRWCLTGTPIQNGLNDIFALTKFLKFEPFTKTKDITAYITGPLSQHDQQGLANLRSMMEVCSIRRVKSDLNLPPIRPNNIPVALSDNERVQYDQVKANLLTELSEAIKQGRGGNSITTLMGIRKLRQICCHGLVVSTEDVMSSETSVAQNTICDGCKATITGVISSTITQGSCRHAFCDTCMSANSQTQEGALDGVWACPVCEQFGDASLADDRNRRLDLASESEKEHADNLAASRATAKMKAVLNALIELHGAQTDSNNPPLKSLVFSYWIRALDTIESGLKLRKIPYVRIDGQTSLQQRLEAITRFQTDPLYTVALLTLGTGSVGLNLTAATHVHLVEPHWNPMVEEQAAARAHRIGQTQPVTVHRYIVRDSIEERIRNMQHQKFHLAHLAGVGEDYVNKYNVGQKDVDGLDGVFEKWQLF